MFLTKNKAVIGVDKCTRDRLGGSMEDADHISFDKIGKVNDGKKRASPSPVRFFEDNFVLWKWGHGQFDKPVDKLRRLKTPPRNLNIRTISLYMWRGDKNVQITFQICISKKKRKTFN